MLYIIYIIYEITLFDDTLYPRFKWSNIFVTFLFVNFIWIISGLKEYLSDPMLSMEISNGLKISGFYSGKGKGKAIDVPNQDKSPSPVESEMDSEEEREIRKAIAISLQKDKIGESSKSTGDNDSSVEHDSFHKLINYTQDWRISNDMFLKTAKLYNNLKIQLDRKTVKSEEDLKLLSKYLEECNKFKLKRDSLEKKLSEHGINPSEQFDNESSSGSESSYSSYSSDISQGRSKRVKYSSADNNSEFSLGFIVFNFTPILRILSCIISSILLLDIHFNILPDLDLCFIKIDLSQLLFLYLVANLTKLMYKWYSVLITLYNHYLNKDYITIYFNIYFSIVIILLYFSSNIDIYTFYC